MNTQFRSRPEVRLTGSVEHSGCVFAPARERRETQFAALAEGDRIARANTHQLLVDLRLNPDTSTMEVSLERGKDRSGRCCAATVQVSLEVECNMKECRCARRSAPALDALVVVMRAAADPRSWY